MFLTNELKFNLKVFATCCYNSDFSKWFTRKNFRKYRNILMFIQIIFISVC